MSPCMQAVFQNIYTHENVLMTATAFHLNNSMNGCLGLHKDQERRALVSW
jgi:hypothetical protein